MSILRSLLRTGLYILDQPDRVTKTVRERIQDGIDRVGLRIRSEDHTLRYVVTFAAGVGVGLAIGVLAAPVSVDESRGAIAGKVRAAGTRVKPISSPEGGGG
jgi:hypothetical protein